MREPQLAVERMSDLQIWSRLTRLMDEAMDAYITGQLSKGGARRYREMHRALVAELRLRGTQTQLDV